MIRINNDWEYTSCFTEGFLHGEKAECVVRIPHTVKELPLHYADSDDYQMISGYRKVLRAEEDWADKTVMIRFDGAAHIATVYCNAQEIITHKNG